MPYVESKDPTTGLVTREYVLPTASATPAAPKPAPKPIAAPAPKPAPVAAPAPSNNPLANLGQAVQTGLQSFAKDLNDRGQESSALIGAARGLTRMGYSTVRNTAQELSDVGTEAIAKIQGRPSPTSAKRPDAPFLGIMPPLPKAKSSGPAEDLAVGIGQFALSWIPVAKGVGLVGKGLSMLPGASKVAGATAAATQAVKATKVAQKIGAVPGAGIVGKSIAENTLTKAAATGGVIDFAAFDQYEGRLTDLLEQMGPLKHLAIDYLKSDPKDVGLDGRFKNVLEGALFGTGLEVAFRTFKAVRATRAVQGAPTEARRAELLPVAVAANNDLETAVIRQQTILPPIAPSPPVAPRTAVQPMGNVAAAGIEPPIPLSPTTVVGAETPRPRRGTPISDSLGADLNELGGILGRQTRDREAYLQRQEGRINERQAMLAAEAADIPGAPELPATAASGQGRLLTGAGETPAAPRQVVTVDNIVLPNTAFRKLTNAKANSAAESYRVFYNAGQTPENQIELAQALAAVRAKGQRFVADGVPGLDIDQALRDMQVGRFTPEVEKLRNAYLEAYSDKPMTQLAPTPAAIPTPAAAMPPVAGPPALTLPPALAKLTPNYGFADRNYKIQFESELDKVAYTLANDVKTRSKSAAKYEKVVADSGLSLQEIRDHGDSIRAYIKDLAQDPAYFDSEFLAVPTQPYSSAQAAPIPTAALSPAPLDLPPASLEVPPAPLDPADMPPMPGDGGDLPPLPPDGGDLPPLPPEPPENVRPPAFDEAWTNRFMAQYTANQAAVDSGEIDIEDLLENNVQRFQSRSGATTYVPAIPEEAVAAYRAFSDVISRVELTGNQVTNNATTAARTDKWLASHGYNSKAILKALKPLSGELGNYERNLVALRSLQLLTDARNYEAGVAANKFLNAGADNSSDMNQLIAELLTAAAEQKSVVAALEGITRPIGQLLYSLQGQRPQPGTLSFTNMDVGADIEKWLTANEGIPIDESIGKALSPEVETAIKTGDYSSPKVMQELDSLARAMGQSAVTPGFAKGFWAQMNKAVGIGSRGLVVYRAAQLLSSGSTMWGNAINNVIRLVQLPVSQALGAGLQLDFNRAGQSMMIYGQYIKNLSEAYRLGTESFKAGRGLYDLDDTTIDFLDKAVRQDALANAEQGAMLEQGAGPQYQGSGEWTLNTTPWLDVQDKSMWAMAQKRMWQTLNLSTRTQVALDTYFKTLAGSSFEYVRNLEPGLNRAQEMGMPKGSQEAWDFAKEYSQAAVDGATKNIVVDGRTILDAVMTSPHAQTAMRYATFTDDIMAEFEPGSAMAGDEIPFFARTFSAMPLVWQNLINLAPVFSIIQPFNRTPGDIVKSAARMTPGVNLFVDTFWRDINSADPMTRDRAIGDVAVGTGAIALAVVAMSQGVAQFTGGGPQEPAAKQKWRDEGKTPYSFRVRIGTDENDMPIYSEYYSMRAFEPFASLFGGIADYIEVANKLPKEAREQLGAGLTMDLLGAVAAGQLSKTYYQGFTELYETLTNMDQMEQGPNKRNPLERYISRVAVSLIPFSSALRSTRRISDPYTRVIEPSDVEGGLGGMPMRMFEETLSEAKNLIPGWSTDLPARLNWITGQPILLSGIMGDQFLPPEHPWMGAVMQFMPWSPASRGPKIDPVLQEMALLHGKGAQFKGPTAEDWGKNNRLSPREYNKYIELTAYVKDEFGRTLYQALEETMNSDFYKSLPQEEISSQTASARATVIDGVVSSFKQRGKQLYENENPALARQLDYIDGLNKDVQYRAKYGQATLSGFVETLR